jgi:alpha-glucosidase
MAEWGASSARQLVAAYEAVLPEGAWPNWVLGNHDQPRIASRVGDAGFRVGQMLLLTLRGTPICYFGDELGMRDGVVPDELTVDPQAAAGRSRDGARTPMQWSLAAHAGFTTPDAEPWLPVGGSYRTINAEVQDVDPRSHLSLFRRLLELRKEHPALHLGSQEIVDAGREELLVFVRQHNEDRVLVILNFGSSEVVVDSLEVGGEACVLCSTLMDRHGDVEIGSLELRSNEGLLLAFN